VELVSEGGRRDRGREREGDRSGGTEGQREGGVDRVRERGMKNKEGRVQEEEGRKGRGER
jgi:hypothetical protein